MRKPFLLTLTTVLLITSIVFGIKAATCGNEGSAQWGGGGTFSVTMEGRDPTKPMSLIPGEEIDMGFTMTVQNGGYDCWVFAHLESSDNFHDYLSYQLEDGWEELPCTNGVYYRLVTGNDSGSVFDIITEDAVTVRFDLTGSDIFELTSAGNLPYLQCHAYTIQAASFTPQEAWKLLIGR